MGQNPNPPCSGLRQLRPAADMQACRVGFSGGGLRGLFRWTRIIQPHSVNLARQNCVLTSYAEPVTMRNELRSKVIEQSKTICIPSSGHRPQVDI
jgi:hypothetical protein